MAKAVCDAASSVIWSCGDLADPGELGGGTRGHDAARAGKDVAVSLEENGVTVVIGFFAEENSDGDIGVFRSEYLFPEVEELAS